MLPNIIITIAHDIGKKYKTVKTFDKATFNFLKKEIDAKIY